MDPESHLTELFVRLTDAMERLSRGEQPGLEVEHLREISDAAEQISAFAAAQARAIEATRDSR